MMLAQSRDRVHFAHVLSSRVQLTDREIRAFRNLIYCGGSIEVNGIFEAAQAAADQYLENVRRHR